jgi:Lon-like ATP-dependent protease
MQFQHNSTVKSWGNFQLLRHFSDSKDGGDGDEKDSAPAAAEGAKDKEKEEKEDKDKGEDLTEDDSDWSETDSKITSIVGPPVIPDEYPEVLVLPVTRTPVFPKFLRVLEVCSCLLQAHRLKISDPVLISKVKQRMKLRQPFAGAFLKKDDMLDWLATRINNQGTKTTPSSRLMTSTHMAPLCTFRSLRHPARMGRCVCS